MTVDDSKISELRATFERENSRKESLENKASYFLGVLSIIVTIICANSSVLGPIEKYSLLGMITLTISIISFLLSIVSCLFMFFPKKICSSIYFK